MFLDRLANVRLGGDDDGHLEPGAKLDVVNGAVVKRVRHGQPETALLFADGQDELALHLLSRQKLNRILGDFQVAHGDKGEIELGGEGAADVLFLGEAHLHQDLAKMFALGLLLPIQSLDQLIFGDQQVVPATIVTPADTTQPTTLTFSVEGVLAGTYVVRLRVDGVDSIPVRTSGPPALLEFDPAQQVIVT